MNKDKWLFILSGGIALILIILAGGWYNTDRFISVMDWWGY